MASGKVARRAVAGDVAALLDSPEIAPLIAALEVRGRGRKGYGPRALEGACLINGLYGLSTWTRVAALIADHPALQEALGGCPSVGASYRFATKLREHSEALADCLDRIAASQQAEVPDLGRDVAIDASNLEAFANGHRHVSKGGAERERYSDPDASWGHRSAISTRGAGSFYGLQDQPRVLHPNRAAARIDGDDGAAERVAVRRSAPRRTTRARLSPRDVRCRQGV